ncbi:hypothetical protein M9H77_05052 [Catharanthus roseus]|uniref:Uncharacterized protein n=1 Tax=Catharanthus roseus TaxID=4058 RepID=A0ACC0CFT3_CATRO|nr:hypothetical protein M9H77_05052 [Catharanthus roseus]
MGLFSTHFKKLGPSKKKTHFWVVLPDGRCFCRQLTEKDSDREWSFIFRSVSSGGLGRMQLWVEARSVNGSRPAGLCLNSVLTLSKISKESLENALDSQWPNEEKIREFKRDFEISFGIFDVGGTMYRTHVSIIAPKIGDRGDCTGGGGGGWEKSGGGGKLMERGGGGGGVGGGGEEIEGFSTGHLSVGGSGWGQTSDRLCKFSLTKDRLHN